MQVTFTKNKQHHFSNRNCNHNVNVNNDYVQKVSNYAYVASELTSTQHTLICQYECGGMVSTCRQGNVWRCTVSRRLGQWKWTRCKLDRTEVSNWTCGFKVKEKETQSSENCWDSKFIKKSRPRWFVQVECKTTRIWSNTVWQWRLAEWHSKVIQERPGGAVGCD